MHKYGGKLIHDISINHPGACKCDSFNEKDVLFDSNFTTYSYSGYNFVHNNSSYKLYFEIKEEENYLFNQYIGTCYKVKGYRDFILVSKDNTILPINESCLNDKVLKNYNNFIKGN